MKAFVSGRLDDKAQIRELFSDLENLGFKITHDWTTTDLIPDKLGDRVKSGQRAAKDITGVVNSDIYILVSDNERPGKGMYVELGAALALNEKFGKPAVYIVGKLNHLTIFYLHPKVRLFETKEKLLSHLKSLNRTA